MLKKTKKIYSVLVPFIIIVMLFSYYFWPLSFKLGDKDQISFEIYKDIDNRKCTYDLDKQEVSDFVRLLKKFRLYHGVSRPDVTISDKIIDVRVVGGLSPIISIYYDTNKTYVYAKIPSNIKPYYRISNKNEIRSFIENIVDTKNAEFKPKPIY
jgi:hypothetical protein